MAAAAFDALLVQAPGRLGALMLGLSDGITNEESTFLQDYLGAVKSVTTMART